jgi:pyridoxine 5-phosphate synthase
MIRLCVNIDHIATIREARGGLDPDPVHGAVISELAGASGIVCHLREDRRHVNERDVRALREIVSTKLDLEMAVVDSIIEIALDVVPDLVTFVPEQREELTTEGGLDVHVLESRYADVTSAFQGKGVAVSFFVEPDAAQIEAVARCGADIVELHTGHYANARTRTEAEAELTRIRVAAELASEAGLVVTAGHGLDLRNLRPITTVPQIEEVSIGRAMFVGLDTAVKEYLAMLSA